MPAMLIDVLYGLTMAIAGAATLHLLCRRARKAETNPDAVEKTCAREVLNVLYDLSRRVSFDIDEHSTRVQQFNDEVQACSDSEVASMVTAVAKIIEANEHMQERLADAEKKLQEQSQIIERQALEVRTDVLTNLFNRRALQSEMHRRYCEFQRFGTPLSIMFVDIDHFKQVNSLHGHAAGDCVLRGVAAVLHQTLREIDVVARYGGEEFVAVMPRVQIEQAIMPAERVRKAIKEATFRFEATDLRVTASIGVAQLQSSEHPSVLLERADAAMYASKQAGRDAVHWHDGRTAHPVEKDRETVAQSPIAEQSQSDCVCSQVQNESGPESEPPKPQTVEDRVEDESAAESVVEASGRSRPSVELQNVTGIELADRSEFCRDVRQRLAEWKRGGPIFSVILVEVQSAEGADNHRVLDGILCDSVARSLVGAVRDMDVVARFSHDCLAIMFPAVEHNMAIRIALRLRQAIETYRFINKGDVVELSLRMGIVEAAESDDSVGLLRRAEEALRKAQNGGGTCIHNGQWSEPIQSPILAT